MGREVQCACRWGGESGAVKALLESDEIIVRGDIKHRVRLAQITNARVDDEGLQFTVGGHAVTLAMTGSEATHWQKKINTPPPSLREKLGLKGSSKALVLGEINDASLREALEGFTATTPKDAAMVIALAQDDGQLAAAAQAHSLLATNSFVWIVHGKGKATRFGETPVREGMRSRGFIDTKVAAVSASLTASRFSRMTAR